MKPIRIETRVSSMSADVYTPVGIYLRLRDRFRDTILLESADHHAADQSYSFIGINAIAGMEIRDAQVLELKYPGQEPQRERISRQQTIPELMERFMSRFACTGTEKEARFAQGLYGYISYDVVEAVKGIPFREKQGQSIPLVRYRLYQYVIAINHHRDELFICENLVDGIERQPEIISSIIRHKDIPVYPFQAEGALQSDLTDENYLDMVEKGMASCRRGDVFQIVLSRAFQQAFTGDEFNVYRALRNVNPSPYLFYFDYGDYRLMGSSPESQLIIKEGRAVVHPIAGTFKRTGDDAADQRSAQQLLTDPKENAEHVMLVDLARNDLSTLARDVKVDQYRQVQYFSHVIHLVSQVSGTLKEGASSFEVLLNTFPAGTLSGAPKHRAMQLIEEYEASHRGFYGGAIGFMGFDHFCNHAIMIRSMLSKNNVLHLRAGAGIVAASQPASELQEVYHKLGALGRAIEKASVKNHAHAHTALR